MEAADSSTCGQCMAFAATYMYLPITKGAQSKAICAICPPEVQWALMILPAEAWALSDSMRRESDRFPVLSVVASRYKGLKSAVSSAQRRIDQGDEFWL